MPRPARYAKGLAKREEILTAALDVIARTGYRGTSVRELAAAVGLSQAGLLHYFASKEELFAAVLAKRDAVNESASAEMSDSAVDGLVSIVRHNADVPGLVQLYAQYSVEASDAAHPSHALFVERYDRLRALLAADVAARQQAGTASPTIDPVVAANLLIAATDGLQTQWLLDPDLDMAAHVSSLVSVLCPAPAPAAEPALPD